MNKSYDYNNSNSNYWQPNNSYSNAPSGSSSSQQFPLSSAPPPPPPFFSQSQYMGQQVQTRVGESTNVPPLYSNSGQSLSHVENEDASKRNVSYPLHGQYLHSSCDSSKNTPRETMNRTNHKAFPPPSRIAPSNFARTDAESRGSGNENCSTETWNYGLSKTDALNRKAACDQFSSHDKQNMTFPVPALNNLGASNQYSFQDQLNNRNSSPSYSNYQGNNNTSSAPDSFNRTKHNFPCNSGFSNSHKSKYNTKLDIPSQPFPSNSASNFEGAFDRVESGTDDNINDEIQTTDDNEKHTHLQCSPLEALESTRGDKNKTLFPTKDLNSIIPDHRRPPPVEIDPNIPQEITAQFKTSSCDLCGVKLNSRLQAKMHYEGRPHGKKVRQAINEIENNSKSSTTDAESLPPKKKKAIVDVNQLYCKCCDLSFTSTIHATQHYMGRNHHRVLHGLKPLQAGYYNKETGQWQRTPPDPITSTEQLGLDDKDDLIADSLKHKGKFFCEICNVAATSKEQLDGHLVGQRHVKKLKALKQAELAESSAAEGSNSEGEQSLNDNMGGNKDGIRKKKANSDGKPKKDFLSKAQETIRSLFESAGTPIDGEEDLFKIKLPEPINSDTSVCAQEKLAFSRKLHKGFLNETKDQIKLLFEKGLQGTAD